MSENNFQKEHSVLLIKLLRKWIKPKKIWKIQFRMLLRKAGDVINAKEMEGVGKEQNQILPKTKILGKVTRQNLQRSWEGFRQHSNLPAVMQLVPDGLPHRKIPRKDLLYPVSLVLMVSQNQPTTFLYKKKKNLRSMLDLLIPKLQGFQNNNQNHHRKGKRHQNLAMTYYSFHNA